MNKNLSNQIKAAINDLSPLSFFVSSADRTAAKSSKLPIRAGNPSTRDTYQRRSSEPSTTRRNGQNTTKTRTANVKSRTKSRLAAPSPNHITRPAEKQHSNHPLTMSPILASEVQIRLKAKAQENEIFSSPPPNNLFIRQKPTNPTKERKVLIASSLAVPTLDHIKEIERPAEKQHQNNQLTIEEREALISSILANELQLRSKVKAQEREIFSSPTPNNLAIRSPSPKANIQGQFSQQPTIPHSTERTTRTISVQDSVNPSASNPRISNQLYKEKMKISLKPIPEISEGTEPIRKHKVYSEKDQQRKHEDFNRNFENVQGIEDIKAQEDIRQQRMESELSNGLILDVDESILVRSDESDSLNELVIKEFAISVVQSEPDAFVSSLPVTEQAIIESRKLSNTIEALKDRFLIKVAEYKDTTPSKRNQSPTKQNVLENKPSAPKTPKSPEAKKYTVPNTEASQSPLKVNSNGQPSSIVSKTPVNIMDSNNWGEIALPEPIPLHRENGSSSNEDFLNENDMQFDDIFGPDNVFQPPTSKQQNNLEQLDNDNFDRRLPDAKVTEIENMENIEDFENPRLSDLPSDESDQDKSISNQNNDIFFDKSENIVSIEDPQFTTHATSNGIANSFASEQPNNQIESRIVIEKNRIISSETQQQKDIKLLGELLSSGALTSSFLDQKFEEGVLDLLLRQSDSLWDPVVSGIPIAYFIPSRNHEIGLLDTSINEEDLDKPLMSEPHKKLPNYLESLESEWRVKDKNNIECNNDDQIKNSSIVNQSPLIHGLPKFTYESVPAYLYKRKVHNIMDSEDEPEDSDDILEDHEMNYDDLVNNVAKPTYDFDVIPLPKKRSNVGSKKNERNIKSHEIKSGASDVFDMDRHRFQKLFGIDENELNSENVIPSSVIELLYHQIPPFNGRIIRNVVNCRYHLDLMKLIYTKIEKYVTQSSQPQSRRTDDYLNEIMKIFNIIRDGRICARLTTCTNNRDGYRESSKNIDENSSAKKDNSSQEKNTTHQTKDKLLEKVTEPEENLQIQLANALQPKNVRRTVTFAKSPQRYSVSKSSQTNYKNYSKTKSGNAASSVNSKVPQIRTATRNNSDFTETPPRDNNDIDQVNQWMSLNISEVKDLIQQARLAQEKHKRSMTLSTKKR